MTVAPVSIRRRVVPVVIQISRNSCFPSASNARIHIIYNALLDLYEDIVMEICASTK